METFKQPGQRLDIILDHVNFSEGRGRISDLQKLISSSTKYSYKDLKYTTVRGWFGANAPTMRKINDVLDILCEDYTLPIKKELISVWWKVGGAFPFPSAMKMIESETKRVEQEFFITSAISENEVAKGLSIEEKIKIKEVLMEFCANFSNPNQSTCSEYILTHLVSSLARVKDKDFNENV